MIKLSIVPQGNHAGRIAVRVSPLLMKLLDKIPGSRYSKIDNAWTVPKSWPSALALAAFAKQVKEQISSTTEVTDWLRNSKAAWSELGQLSSLVQGPGVTGEFPLYGHQVLAADWLTHRADEIPFRLLLDDVGTGKTRSVIAGVDKAGLLDRGPVLVIAPSKVKYGWAKEYAMMAPKARVGIVKGNVTQRRKMIQQAADGELDVLVIGWESMRLHTRMTAFPGVALKRCPACGGSKDAEVTEAKCESHERELNRISWSVIVADEIHRAKNPKSKTTQALWGLAHSAPKSLRWGLTGTITSKTPEDIWPLLHWLDDEIWPVKSKWVDYYCTSEFDMYGHFRVTGLNQKRSDEFQKSFSVISRRVLKEQVLDMPPVLRGGTLVRQLEMGKEQAAAYTQMREEMIAWVKEGKITAANVMVQTGRLMMLAQAAGTPREIEKKVDGEIKKGLTVDLRMPSCKVTGILDDLLSGDFDGHSVIAFFESRKLLRLFEDELLKHDDSPWANGVCSIAGDVSEAAAELAMNQFQAGKKNLILMTYGAAREGITLTAADTMLLAQRSWSQLTMKQALARNQRLGAEIHDRLTVIDYVTEDSVELKQLDRNITDEELFQSIVQDEKRMLEFLS